MAAQFGSTALMRRSVSTRVDMMDHHSLQPRTWVTEGAVNFVLILLMHDTLQPDNSDHSPVSYPVQMIKVGDWRAFSDFSLHPPDEPAPQLGATLFTDPSDAVNTSWLDAAVTFIPICSGAHYFLAVVVEPRRYLAAVALDPASKGAGGEEVLYILNSKGTVGQASAAQHVFRAIRLAGGVAAAPQADISSWWTDEIDVPQQPEGHECGIYVAVFVRKILEGLRANESITTILASLKDEISDVDDLAERDTFATLILNEIVDFHATPHSRGLDDVESVPNFLQLDSYDQAASNELVANEAAIMARNAALPKLPPVDGARATWMHATLPKWEASLPVRFGPAPPGPITDAQLAAAQANTQALYYSKRAGSELTMLLASCAEELRDDLNGTTLLRAYMAVIGAADALIENDARIRSLPYMELRDEAMMKLPGVLQAAEPTSAELTAAMLNIPAISDLVRDAARLPHAVRRELDYSAIWRNDEIRKVLMLKNGSCSMRATLILNRIRGARKHYQLQKWSIIIDLFELKHLLGIMKGQHTQRQWVMVMKNIFTDLVEYTELHTAMSATANIFTTPARMSAISDLISNGSVTHLYTRLTLIHSFSAGLDAIYYDSSNPQDDAAKDAALAKLKEKWREILSSPDSTANIKSNLVDEVRAHNAKLIGAAQSSVVAPRRLSLRSRNSANYKPTAPIKIIARANPSPITIGGSDGSDASGQCDASDWSDGSDGAMDQTIWILPGQTMIQLFSALSHHRILILSLTTDISTALASAHVLVGAPLPNVILAIKFVLKEIPASDGKGKVRSKVDTDMSIRDVVKKRQRAAMIRLQIVDAHGNSAVVVEKMIEADNAKPPAQRKFAAPQTQQDMRDSATEKDEREEETNEHSLRNMNRQNHSLYSLRLTDATRNSPLTDRKFDHELDGMTRPLQGRTSQAAFMYYQMSPFFSDTYVVVHTGHLDTFVSESMGKVRDSLSVVMKPDGDSDVPPIATLIALAAGVANGDHGTDVTILSGQALAVRGGVPFTARSFDVTMSVMYHLPATWLQDGKGLTMVVAFLEEIVGLAHADGAWDIVTPPFEEIGADHFDGLVQRDSVVGTALASVVPHATACALFKAIQEDVRRVLQRAATHVDYDKYGPDDAAFDRLGHAIKLLHCARPTYEQYGLDVCDCDDVNSADVAANVIAFRAGFTQ